MSDYLSKEKCELNVCHTAFIATVAEIKKSVMHPFIMIWAQLTSCISETKYNSVFSYVEKFSLYIKK